MVQALIGMVIAGFLATLVFGLATKRIAWRQQGCCPANPEHDLRMRDPSQPIPDHHTPNHHTAPPEA